MHNKKKDHCKCGGLFLIDIEENFPERTHPTLSVGRRTLVPHSLDTQIHLERIRVGRLQCLVGRRFAPLVEPEQVPLVVLLARVPPVVAAVFALHPLIVRMLGAHPSYGTSHMVRLG